MAISGGYYICNCCFKKTVKVETEIAGLKLSLKELQELRILCENCYSIFLNTNQVMTAH